MGKYKKELLFTLAVLAAAAGLWLAPHAGRGTATVAVVRSGDPQVNSPCPDHLCEGFGILQNAGDWAACMPARTSITIEEK